MKYKFPVQVYYEDTDAGGVVYYANYLKFMERARTEWLRDLGFEQDELMQEQGILFAVRHVELDYLRPARFNDRLLVTAELTQQGGASFTLYQEVVRKTDNQVLAKGTIKIACLSAWDFQPTAIPESIIQKMQNAE